MNSACIITASYRNSSGYGQTWVAGKLEYTHRAAFAKANGLTMQDLKGKVIMHTCDNPGCINPEHLKLGTHEENAADRHAKGRTINGTTRGLEHHFNMLSEQAVHEIRVSIVSTRKLAKIYGVSQGAICGIQQGRNWKHLPWKSFTKDELITLRKQQLTILKEKLHE